MFHKRFLMVWLVVGLGIAVSIILYAAVGAQERQERQLRFESKAADRIAALKTHIGATTEAVLSIVGLFESSVTVDRDEFQRFAEGPLSRYVGIQALVWAPKVMLDVLDVYETLARVDGLDDFAVTERDDTGKVIPADRRDTYFPVFFIEPYRENEAVLGFDLASDPTRLLALTEARDTGRPRATLRVNLVPGRGQQFGFLFAAPVYERALPLETVADRRRALTGFAVGVFRIRDMIAGALTGHEHLPGGADDDIEINIYDLDAPPDRRTLYFSAGGPVTLEEAVAGPHLSTTFEVGARKWRIVARPHDPTFAMGRATAPALSLFTGLAFTALFAAYLASVIGRTHTVEALVRDRTRALTSSELRAGTVLDNTVDGIIVIDAGGIIETFNPAAERIFGYAEEELVGRNVSILMPEPHRSAHDEHLARYLRTGEAHVIGVGREVEGQRKDGSVFPMDLAVNEVRIDDRPIFVGMVRDLTERKKVERMKNEFVSTVSHELRTPLTSIMGSLGLLKGGAVGGLPSQAARMVEVAHQNSERLVRLINDILDMEKIASGRMPFNRRAISVPETVARAIATNQGYAHQHDVTLEAVGKPPEVSVHTDPDRIDQVMTNLIGNAVKFSPAGGRVEVTAWRDGEHVIFAVLDFGPGIPEDFRDRIFTRFSQADSSDTRKKGGTGLGLNICKAIVERHGGRLWFESTPGERTVFSFTVPLYQKEEAI